MIVMEWCVGPAQASYMEPQLNRNGKATDPTLAINGLGRIHYRFQVAMTSGPWQQGIFFLEKSIMVFGLEAAIEFIFDLYGIDFLFFFLRCVFQMDNLNQQH